MVKQKEPTYEDRLKALLEKPGLIDEVCKHLVEGGDLIELSKSWDIRYSDLSDWLRYDRSGERPKRLAAAVEAGNEWARQRVLKEMKRIALVDIRDAYDENGNILPIKQMPAELAAAIAAVESDELYEGRGPDRERVGDTKKLKLWPKIEALKEIGKELGIFTPKLKVEGTLRLEDLVAGSKDQPNEAA